MGDRTEKLLEKATDAERNTIEILRRAVEKTQAAYEDGFSAAKKRDWDAAVEGYDAAIARLESKYMPSEPPFKNRLEVLKHLVGAGYKVSQGRLYKDAAAGLLTVQPDGTVFRSDVSDYILRAGLEKIANESGQPSVYAEEEARERIRKLQNQNMDLEFRRAVEQGKFILKEEVYTQLAVKIGAFEAAMKYMTRVRAVDWIDATGGNAAKKQILIDLAEADLDDVFAEFGRMDELEITIAKREDLAEASESQDAHES